MVGVASENEVEVVVVVVVVVVVLVLSKTGTKVATGRERDTLFAFWSFLKHCSKACLALCGVDLATGVIEEKSYFGYCSSSTVSVETMSIGWSTSEGSS